MVRAASAAYVLFGLVYAIGQTIYYALLARNADAFPPPWSSPIAFLAGIVLPAALWPWSLIGLLGFSEILVACVYLATVGLFYLAASRRSAPRRLKSRYPNAH